MSYDKLFFVFVGNVNKKKKEKMKSAFDQELTNTGKSAVKKFRAG